MKHAQDTGGSKPLVTPDERIELRFIDRAYRASGHRIFLEIRHPLPVCRRCLENVRHQFIDDLGDQFALDFIQQFRRIEIFLREGGHRIVAEEGEVVEEVRTEAELSGDDDLVTEDLAEIYLAQGLYDEAIAIYRKLSLLNPEKSVYFASLIDKIANK